MKHFITYKEKLLFLVLFTLPMFTEVNIILFWLYVAVAFLDGNFSEKYKLVKQNWAKAMPVFFLFILAVIASINNPADNPLKHLENYWCYLVLPLAFISQKNFYIKNRNAIFTGLLYGCVATLLLCYGNVIYEMVLKDEPLEYLFRWRHLGHQFTAIADAHPAYLGLFIIVSTMFLLESRKMGIYPKIAILTLFTLGMFQMVSRMVLFIYMIILIFEIWTSLGMKSKLFKTIAVVIAGFAILAVFYGSDYYKNRIFPADSIKQEKRLERLIVSYEMFKENPILGAGYGMADSIRIKKYKELNFEIYEDQDYDARNQFMETLGTNGLFGVLVFALVLGVLIIRSFDRKEYLFTAIFLIFIVTNLTESMLVRIKGIEFFALFCSLFLSSLIPSKQES